MIITVFGATGMVGKHLVKHALWKGHHVKAFGRSIHDFDIEDEKLELIKGALFDEKQLFEAISGSDAVLSALGGAIDGEDKTRSIGMRKIVNQMERAGVNRIVAVGGLGVLDADQGGLIIDSESYPQEFLHVGNEHLNAYKVLESSKLDWTFVCPPDIIDAETSGAYYTKANMPPPGKGKINAGDLSYFMVMELENNEFSKNRVGISN